ncbi:MAG: glycosyltransferase, partial [Verrucomicrobiota bacterium]
MAVLQELEPDFTARGWRIVRQKNRYLGAARNTGARNASGEYLLFMDDDNYAEPGEIATLVEVAEHTGADIVCCGMNYFGGYDAPDRKEPPKGRWLPLGPAAAVGAFKNCFGDANALVKRSCFESLGGFTEDYGVTHEDWEFHAKAVLRGYKLEVVPEFLFWYRGNADSMIRTLNSYPNYMRSIRPYLDAVPEELRQLVYLAQGLQMRHGDAQSKTAVLSPFAKLTIPWRSKLEAARVLVTLKQPKAAAQILREAIKAAEATKHPLIIFEAMVGVAAEMRRLDRSQARHLAELAVELAGMLKDPVLMEKARELLNSCSGAERQFGVRPLAMRVEVSGSEVNAAPPVSVTVSIVIPAFNKVELTRQCLATIQKHTPAGRYEVIVLDNASTDATRDLLAPEDAVGRLRVISNPENRGFAKACNQGAQAARGKYILFLNNDTEVQPGWLDALVSLADADPTVAAVGSKLLFPNGTLQHAGVAIGEVQGRDPFLPVHTFYKAEADLAEANQRRIYQALTAACLLVRKSAFEAVGGFDEGFWNGYEDVDLCLRLQEQGWLMVYEPASVVIHHESQSGPARFAKVKENIHRLHQKWLGKAKLDVSVAADGTVTPAGTTRIRPYTLGSVEAANTSIVILSYNQLAHTKACLESIARHTSEPYELILVDNGSTDGTSDYLREYAAQHERVLVVANRTNRGFAAGNNQGLALATGRQVLCLNNDTVVSPGWLGSMLRVLQEHPQTGVVGPRSNRVLGQQQVDEVGYKSLAELPAFAAAWAETNAGKSRVANRVVGFCLLARREVIKAVGGLDEQFGSGNFEDDDFCVRAHLAGFATRIADDSFVHHVGHATFTGAGIDYTKAMQTNWTLFKSKWAIPAEMPSSLGYFTPDVAPPGVALKVPLPELPLTHQLSVDGRCWMDKLMAAAAKAKPITLPPCALVGQLREAQQFLQQKKLPAAWGATRAALKHRPFHPDAYLLLAEIALAAQDSVAALACAQFARQIAPEFRPAKKFLKGKLHGHLKPEWLVLPEEIGKHKAESRNWLSVCLIVKNEERFLGQCLASIKGLAHQVVVVDTGSTDRTVEIAREHGAQVHSFAWCDDFSAARNAALEHVTGDWVLILDADEELPPEQHAALRKLLHNISVISWRLPLQDVGREAEGCSYVPRLFRNAPGLYYAGRVHEQVFTRIEERRAEWGLETRLGDATLRHYGYTKELTLERDKVGRNLRLLEQAIIEAPGDTNLLMNYGLELTRSGRREEGLRQYRAAFEAMADRS